jgi:hypothetical protein
MSDLINPENWSEVETEAKSKRWEYWNTMAKIRKEFIETLDPNIQPIEIIPLFERHMLDVHGIRVKKNSEGQYISDYDIMDEQKYLMYKLKYS